jgi:predicted transcriptional regulator
VQARNNSTERSALRARRLRGPLAAMTSRTKLENLTVRLEPETREALERVAEREERPLAYLVRRALRTEAARRERQEGAAA